MLLDKHTLAHLMCMWFCSFCNVEHAHRRVPHMHTTKHHCCNYEQWVPLCVLFDCHGFHKGHIDVALTGLQDSWKASICYKPQMQLYPLQLVDLLKIFFLRGCISIKSNLKSSVVRTWLSHLVWVQSRAGSYFYLNVYHLSLSVLSDFGHLLVLSHLCNVSLLQDPRAQPQDRYSCKKVNFYS